MCKVSCWVPRIFIIKIINLLSPFGNCSQQFCLLICPSVLSDVHVLTLSLSLVYVHLDLVEDVAFDPRFPATGMSPCLSLVMAD